MQQFGQIPQGSDENELDREIYLYNPNALPGVDKLEELVEEVDGQPYFKQGLMSPLEYIEVDGDIIYFPRAYIELDDTEPTPGKTYNDL